MNALSPEDKKILFQRLARGDEAAFRVIFDLYKDRLYFIVLKMVRLRTVAEEVAQDILTNIWVNQNKFKDIVDPEAYMISMTYNGVFSHMKRIAKDQKLLKELVNFVEKESVTVEDLLVSKESLHSISAAVAALPAQQKRVFSLSRERGMSYKQIAGELDLSIHTVRNHLAQAIKNIRSHLGEAVMSLSVFLLAHLN
jgi:RNA polymerase sigma-70 factor (family 1)